MFVDIFKSKFKIKIIKFMTKAQIFSFISNQKLSWVLQLSSCFFWVTSFIYPSEHHMHPLQTNLSRAIICLIANFAMMRYYGGELNLKDPQTYFYATCRCVTNTLYGMFVAGLMFYLPMPIIHTISSSSSIHTAAIEHYCFGVSISLRSRWLILVSVLGVMLQANGEYISMKIWHTDFNHNQSLFKNYEHVTILQSILISFVFLLYVTVWSYGLVVVKRIKMKHYQLNLYNNIVLVLMTGLAYMIFVSDQNKSSFDKLGISLLTSGIFVLGSQVTFVIALQICTSVGLLMMLNTANILIAYLYSLIRYQQKLDIFSMIGMLITVTCIFLVIFDKYK